MGFNTYRFTKKWTEPRDFPTTEDNEEKVRADIQYLFDELLANLNEVTGDLYASNIPYDGTDMGTAKTVKAALQYVLSQVQSAVAGTIPDGSVTTTKLGPGAVTSAKLDTDAVTSEKIKDGEVTNAKLATGIDAAKLTGTMAAGVTFGANSVGATAIADNAIRTRHIKDGEVTSAKIASVAASKIDGTVAAATKASKLANTAAIGSATKPVYVKSDGTVTACTYTLGKSVPSDAVFKYDPVSTTAAGLMSAEDKVKLNNIATGANKYTLPTANASTLGGVKLKVGTSEPTGTPAAGELYFKVV